jgi:hypothetical protein
LSAANGAALWRWRTTHSRKNNIATCHFGRLLDRFVIDASNAGRSTTSLRGF